MNWWGRWRPIRAMPPPPFRYRRCLGRKSMENHDGWLRARWRRSTRAIVATAATCTGIAVLIIGLAVGTAAAGVSPGGRGSLNAALAAPAVSSVGAGNAHTCAIGTDGTLWCWGSNYR